MRKLPRVVPRTHHVNQVSQRRLRSKQRGTSPAKKVQAKNEKTEVEQQRRKSSNEDASPATSTQVKEREMREAKETHVQQEKAQVKQKGQIKHKRRKSAAAAKKTHIVTHR